MNLERSSSSKMNQPSSVPGVHVNPSTFTTSSVGKMGKVKVDKDSQKVLNKVDRMRIRSIVFSCLATLIKNFSKHRSEYFTYLAKYEKTRANLIEKNLTKCVFGNALQSKAMNLVQKQSYSDFKSILTQKNAMTPENFKPSNASGRLIELEICKGISLDLADKFVNKKTSMQDLMGLLSKGGSVEAEINQAIYSRSSEPIIPREIVGNLFEAIRSDKGSLLYSAFFSVDKESTLKLFDYVQEGNLKEKIQNKKKENFFIKLNNKNLKSNYVFSSKFTSDKAAAALLKLIIHKHNYEPTWFDEKTGSVNYFAMFDELKNELDHLFKQANETADKLPKKKKEEAKKEIIKKRTEILKQIKIIGPAVHPGILSDIKDPEMGLIRDYFVGFLQKSGHYVAGERSLILKSTKHIMGESSSFLSDHVYLKNLDKLQPGFYNVSLNTAYGGHSISLIILDDKEIKEDGFKGCIIDPNVGSLAFKSMDDAKTLMEQIVNSYESPPVYRHIKASYSHHQLKILQCVPIH